MPNSASRSCRRYGTRSLDLKPVIYEPSQVILVPTGDSIELPLPRSRVHTYRILRQYGVRASGPLLDISVQWRSEQCSMFLPDMTRQNSTRYHQNLHCTIGSFATSCQVARPGKYSLCHLLHRVLRGFHDENTHAPTAADKPRVTRYQIDWAN